MANPEHLKILKQGVEVWNGWRESQLALPELSGADLSETNLVGVNLSGADLTEADLRNAELGGAYLRSAVFVMADLSGAQLGGANLGEATLSNAKLTKVILIRANLENAHLDAADLQCADLGGACIRSVVLRQTNLAQARLFHTSLGDLDLTEPRNLDRVWHLGPSTIGTDTLTRTALRLERCAAKASIIDSFLRGAGLTEELLEYFHSLIGNPIQFYTSFISYSHTDQSFARRLYAELQAHGIRCWLDEHALKPGDRILDVVNDAIRIHDKILLCCSEASLNSWWVKDEIEKALERERREDRDIIIPLNLDGYLLDGWESGQASTIRARLAADFTGWEHDNAKFEEQFEQVLRALRTNEEDQEPKAETR